MAVFVVTTGEDVVDAGDGELSLREAVAAAKANGSGTDTIRFQPGDGAGHGVDSNVVKLKSSLKIDAGNAVVIDGSIGDLVEGVWLDGGYTGNPFATDGFTMLEVASGANVTITNTTFVNGFERGAKGKDGIAGTDGLAGNDGHTEGDGTPGSSGNGGTGGSSATTVGKMGVAGIENRGNLILDKVIFNAMNAFGGAGGDGGRGGNGGKGGNGQSAFEGPGGSGGNGGSGATAGHATDAGDAVGAIYNIGTLTLTDTMISGVAAYGGQGGRGGAGGTGGAGGKGGMAEDARGGYGGNGGHGAQSGNSADGGDAASAIWNVGTIHSTGTTAGFLGHETAGAGGGLVQGGARGAGGVGGAGSPKGDNGISGIGGASGKAGVAGTKAGSNHVMGNTGDIAFAKNAFFIDALTTEVEEGFSYRFVVKRLGDKTGEANVTWTISGLGAADFGAGQALKQDLTFAAGEWYKIVNVSVKADGIDEFNEKFKIALGGASTGSGLGASTSLDVTIEGENRPPSNLKISDDTIELSAAVGSVVGTLSATDPDGDPVTFDLAGDFGGFFQIVGNTLQVAKRLDGDQHSYALLIDATDPDGARISKTITIKLAGYIDGDAGNNSLRGTAGADKIFGFSGNDRLHGYAGADQLQGGEGDDLLRGGAGADWLQGGTGIDTASYAGAEAGVRANISDPTGNTNDAAGDTYSSIENLIGSSFGDVLLGSSNSNRIDGTGGNDRLDGAGGNDVLIGGADRDHFLFISRLGTPNIDTIADFTVADDTIDLSKSVFSALGSGVSESEVRVNKTGEAEDRNDFLIYENDTGKLFYDSNGSLSGGRLQFAVLDKNLALTNADFVMI